MPASRRCFVVDIASLDYLEAWRLQGALLESRQGGGPDVILLLEHPAVFTLGRRGRRNGLRVPEAFLEKRNIPLVHVERGGDITYHGPGQLVGYPIMDLRALGWKVVDFVGALEEVMIRTAAQWGISAERNALNRGIWVHMKKMGSVGIAVRRGVSFHGFALNVNTSLTPFDWIEPCGLHGVKATSMAQIMGKRVSMEAVREAVQQQLKKILYLDLIVATLGDIQHILIEDKHSH
jgi:lipoate-protein ligase B